MEATAGRQKSAAAGAQGGGVELPWSRAERTAKEVHSTLLCAMVTAQAATFSAWAAYETVLVDPETAAFFASRLSVAA